MRAVGILASALLLVALASPTAAGWRQERGGNLESDAAETVAARGVLHRAATELLRGERGDGWYEVSGWTPDQLRLRVSDTQPSRRLIARWNTYPQRERTFWTERLVARGRLRGRRWPAAAGPRPMKR